MVEEAADDYAKILRAADFDKEINPLCLSIEDMLARLDEFETLLSNVRAETNSIMANNVCGIIKFSDDFKLLRDRIDSLEHFVSVVNNNLDEVEKSVEIAEEELNVTDYSFKSLVLKPLLAKAKLSTSSDAAAASPRSNLKEGVFQPVPIFKTDEYFNSANNDDSTP